MDMDAQGVARKDDGKVVFIDGALPTELVSANTHRKKNNWEQASLTAIHRESSQRVRPGCPHFGLHAGACGGCKMQHLHADAQVAVKQRVLEDNLWHLGKVKPETILRPIQGPAWGYRYRARLSVRYVAKKGVVLVGFHERKSRYIADMQTCKILPPHVDAMLMPLRALIGGMQARDTCPQIELACGDTVTALVLRHLEPLSDADKDQLRAFAAAHGVQWWLQPKGPDTVHLLDEGGEQLAYGLPDFGITMPFRPTDFTQVNPHINRVLVTRALRLLDARKDERVIDWFCGLGNFTLPIAAGARGAGHRGQRGAGRPFARELQEKPDLGAGGASAGSYQFRSAQPVRDDARDAHRRRRGRQMAGGPAARGRIRPVQSAGRHPSGPHRRRGRAAAARRQRGLGLPAPHRLRELQPRHAGARRGPAGAPGGLPLRGGGRGQHVPAHRARGEHGGVRARGLRRFLASSACPASA
jgi:23S rRNA (uracil-5-)-methyltransferase RumA